MAERTQQHRLMESGSSWFQVNNVMDSYVATSATDRVSNGRTSPDIRGLSPNQIVDLTTHLIMGQVDSRWLPATGTSENARTLLSQINFKEFNLPAVRGRITGAYSQAAESIKKDAPLGEYVSTLEALEDTGSILAAAIPQDKLTREDEKFVKKLYSVVREADSYKVHAPDRQITKHRRIIQRMTELGLSPVAIAAGTKIDAEKINDDINILRTAGALPLEASSSMRDIPIWPTETKSEDSLPIVYIDTTELPLEPFPLYLNLFRTQSGLSGLDFAKQLGIRRRYYEALELGRMQVPKKETLTKIKEVVNEKAKTGDPAAQALDTITTMLLDSTKSKRKKLQDIRREVPFQGVVVFNRDGIVHDYRPQKTDIAPVLEAINYNPRLPYTIRPMW